ncbi:hypothetical protein [Xenorhabdus sp. PB30.3]|uniref:hypothetical protein n=1 Tax=Xenorhabdus sp. PB30.3 TaxID=2788941 RepID=UPI001E594F5F|nr:hypothetical protein [Xenorhabdus sp. PB30.3]MCC8380064.1 hypothetical protein [Xenorhabdus sp. PB30.3]
MNSEIFQLLSLATYGNAYLEEKLYDKFYPKHVAFKFCQSVKFVDLQKNSEKWLEIPYASDPISWLDKLKNYGVKQLRTCYLSFNDEKKCDWLLEVVNSNYSDFWKAKWEWEHDNTCRVTYVRVQKSIFHPQKYIPKIPSLTEMKSEFEMILKEISSFSHKNGYPNFGNCFDRGLKYLSGGPSHDLRGSEIFPIDYMPEECNQLIYACLSSWVFGGMGSWNDIFFPDPKIQKEYEALSQKLFSSIYTALLVASNPFPRI